MDIIYQPGTSFAAPVTRITFRGGKEIYLCNKWLHVDRCLKDLDKFTANQVINMEPKHITITSADVMLAEDLT